MLEGYILVCNLLILLVCVGCRMYLCGLQLQKFCGCVLSVFVLAKPLYTFLIISPVCRKEVYCNSFEGVSSNSIHAHWK